MERTTRSIRSNKTNQPKKLNIITNKKEEIKWNQNTLKIYRSLGLR